MTAVRQVRTGASAQAGPPCSPPPTGTDTAAVHDLVAQHQKCDFPAPHCKEGRKRKQNVESRKAIGTDTARIITTDGRIACGWQMKAWLVEEQSATMPVHRRERRLDSGTLTESATLQSVVRLMSVCFTSRVFSHAPLGLPSFLFLIGFLGTDTPFSLPDPRLTEARAPSINQPCRRACLSLTVEPVRVMLVTQAPLETGSNPSSTCWAMENRVKESSDSTGETVSIWTPMRSAPAAVRSTVVRPYLAPFKESEATFTT